MAPRYTPTEVKRLVEVLEDEHEDVEALAKSILIEITELRRTRKRWVGLVLWRGKTYAALGPFASAKAAREAAQEAPSVGADTRYLVIPLGPPVEEADGEEDAAA